MTYSTALYQPSLLELAQAGNCQALTYWMNSLLSPQGVQIQVQPAPDQFFKILIDFRRPRRREACLHLREQLTRFICYRLWTLNSDAIQGVRLVARMTGDPKLLWQTSVRINSPAGARRRHRRRQQTASQMRFQLLRSLFMSSFTLAGFLIGYWLLHGAIGRALEQDEPSAPALTDSLSGVELPNGQIIRIPPPPSQTDFTVPKQAEGTVVSQVDLPNAEKLIALTFDNGPDPEITPQILDILRQYQVQATFFMSGVKIEQQPDLARRIVAERHAVGNRGWNWLSAADQNIDAEHEVKDTAKLIEETTGAKTALFRPSTGDINSPLVNYAKRHHQAVILWSIDSQDPLVAAPILLDNVLRNAQPGRIVLLHDGLNHGSVTPTASATVQALPQMITALQNQGYQFVTMPQLLQRQHPQSEASPDPNGSDSRAPAASPKASPKASPTASPETSPGSNLKPDAAPAAPALQKPSPEKTSSEKTSSEKTSGDKRQIPSRKQPIALVPAPG